MKVGLCQIEVVCGDRDGNFMRVEEALHAAKLQGADLAVLPESCILGWINPEAHLDADPIPGRDSVRLCELARQLKIAVIAGMDEKSDDRLYDSAVSISAEGVLLGVHRKSNVLPELMEPPYSCGDGRITVVDFSFGRVGVLICADTFGDEWIAAAIEAKVDLLAVPYGWVATDDTWPEHGKNLEHLICRRASELGCHVIGVDCVGEVGYGPWKGRRYCGASIAADGSGSPLSGLLLAVSQVTVVEIPPPT